MTGKSCVVLLLSVILYPLGASAQVIHKPIWSEGPVVEAIGRATVEFPPNRGSFSVSFAETAKTSAEVSRKAIERANKVTDALREAGGDDIRLTANVSVEPYYEQVTLRDEDGSEYMTENVHPDALKGYQADADLDVTVLDPDKLAELRGVALYLEPDDASDASFWLEPTTENKRQAFRAAVDDARERAEVAASGSGRNLGGLLFLTEGVTDCVGTAESGSGREAPASLMVTGQRVRADKNYVLAADPDPESIESTVCAVYALQ